MKALAAAALILGSAAAATPAEPSLAELVREIQSADYRGARADLQRLAGSLDGVKDPKLAAYTHYWRGFALWRRALNGFNETPAATDLETDLKAAIASFQAALHEQPEWVEARIGIVGCVGPLFFLAAGDAARREALLKEYLPVLKEMGDKGADNPRALWLQGQNQLVARPGGPHPEKAVATFHRGVEAALAEARRVGASEPAWIPRWGGAENLMNLAYAYTHTTLANRDLALAYAEGALVAAPEWHYVRDILWAEIEALPQPTPAPVASPAAK